jgi:hypothetical protein
MEWPDEETDDVGDADDCPFPGLIAGEIIRGRRGGKAEIVAAVRC